MKQKFMGTAALLLAAVLFLEIPVGAVSAEKAAVLDSVGNHLVYRKRAEERSLIASTTKIMTCLLIAENCNVLEQVRIPREAVGIEGSSMYLTEGEVLTVQELLYGLMLRSGNDAAAALAIHCDGSLEAFAERMNEKARELHMDGTHFENPHGLDGKNHYSTARDLGILGAYAMENPIFRKTVSTKSVTLGERYLKNHNRLLWRYPGCDGIKTGYTKAAGRILVSSALRSGRRLTCVTINDPDDWNTHCRLLSQGFSRYREKKILEAGQILENLPVLGGREGSVPLVAGEEVSLLLAEGERTMTILPGPGFAYAPVTEGTLAGEMLVVISGKVMERLPVYYGKTVEQAQEEKSIFERIFGDRS